MKKKIIGILVCTLFLFATILPVSGTINKLNVNDIDTSIEKMTWGNSIVGGKNSITFNPTADSYVSEGYPDDNYGTDNCLYIQSSTVDWKNMRSYLQFDVSSIPDDAVITDVSLRLFCLFALIADTWSDLYGFDDAWSEDTVTWNNQPCNPYSDPVLASREMTSGDATSWCEWSCFDLTQYVRDHLADDTVNLMLKTYIENDAGLYSFWSNDYTENNPELVINYVDSQDDQICFLPIDYVWLPPYPASEWQEFVPTLNILDAVSLPIAQGCPGCDMLVLEIWDNNGNLLTYLGKPAIEFPDYNENPWTWYWTTFDISDVPVTPGDTYIIDLHWAGGAEYAWAGFDDAESFPDGPYPQGISSVSSSWDFCFITWGHNDEPPDRIVLKGPTEGVTNIDYTYYVWATDPDKDDISYRFDWGDGQGWGTWSNLYPPRQWQTYTNKWTTPGQKTIKYQAKDEHGKIGDSEEQIITINNLPSEYTDVYIKYNPLGMVAPDFEVPPKDNIYSGNTVEFKIVVYNDGNKNAENVRVRFKITNNIFDDSVYVDVPMGGSTEAKISWTVPYLEDWKDKLLKHDHGCPSVTVYHDDDIDKTPYNKAFAGINYNIKWFPRAPKESNTWVYDSIPIYNENPSNLDVIIDLEFLDPPPPDWVVYMDQKHLTIEPESIGWVNLFMIPPENISHGEKIEVVVSAYEETNYTRDELELPFRSVCIIAVSDDPPGEPSIDGPDSGKKGETLTYVFNAVDPDGDDVKYCISWGDGHFDWTNFAASGTPVTVSHTWDEVGDYTITGRAYDSYGVEGPEITKTVKIPRNRAIAHTFFLRFLQQFPNAFLILRQLLGL